MVLTFVVRPRTGTVEFRRPEVTRGSERLRRGITAALLSFFPSSLLPTTASNKMA